MRRIVIERTRCQFHRKLLYYLQIITVQGSKRTGLGSEVLGVLGGLFELSEVKLRKADK